MTTREVSHGMMIAKAAASAAKRRTAPPTGPENAPPNEIGESFVGPFGLGGSDGAFGVVVERGGAMFAFEVT